MTQPVAATPGAPLHAEEPLRFPTLDGVRFYAYLAVFLSHALPITLGEVAETGALDALPVDLGYIAYAGGFGVDLFLVLSAFLITSLLLKEQDAIGTIHVGDFYVRRMLRIWPLYLVFLGTMFLLSRLRLGWEGFQAIDSGYWIAFLLLVGNWFTGLVGYSESNIDPLWSISLEEQFYLLWPWLLLLFRRRLVQACVVLWGVSVFARLGVIWLGLEHPAMWVFTITRLDPIVLGCLLALANRRNALPKLGPGAQWLLVLGGFASWPILHALVPMNGRTLGAALITLPSAALAATGILLAAVTSTGRVKAMFMHPWVARMGGLSYGTYVLHYMTLHLTLVLLAGQTPWLKLALVPLVAFLLAWGIAEVSYRWLESPFLRLRKRFRPSGRSPLGARPGYAAAPSLQDEVPPGRGP